MNDQTKSVLDYKWSDYLFLFANTGMSLLSNLLSFLVSEPKLVIPNLPKTYGECYLLGKASQFPFILLAVPKNLSISLSHEIHFTCFFVIKASF
jgi:hypothetical protein